MEFLLISPKDVSKYFNCYNVIIVDIREKKKYICGHIEGAINIPYDELENHQEELQKYSLVILYCDRGNQSMRSAKIMNNKNFRVGSIAGGCMAYKTLGNSRSGL